MFQDFLANLNPFPDMNCTEIDNYLWAKSSDLEKHCSDTQRKRPKEAERRWKSLDLRSPGISIGVTLFEIEFTNYKVFNRPQCDIT